MGEHFAFFLGKNGRHLQAAAFHVHWKQACAVSDQNQSTDIPLTKDMFTWMHHPESDEAILLPSALSYMLCVYGLS